jgi:hypothetical protein
MRRLIIATIITLSTLVACAAPAAEAAPKPAPTATDWKAVIQRQRNERLYWAEVIRQQQRRAADTAWQARVAAYWAALHAPYPHGLCGGDLPPCWVVHRESKGDIRIWNGGCYAPVGWTGRRSPCGGSTASGKFQFIRGSWGNFRGYLNAADAPERVQDDRARQLYDHGRGGSHWGL